MNDQNLIKNRLSQFLLRPLKNILNKLDNQISLCEIHPTQSVVHLVYQSPIVYIFLVHIMEALGWCPSPLLRSIVLLHQVSICKKCHLTRIWTAVKIPPRTGGVRAMFSLSKGLWGTRTLTLYNQSEISTLNQSLISIYVDFGKQCMPDHYNLAGNRVRESSKNTLASSRL